VLVAVWCELLIGNRVSFSNTFRVIVNGIAPATKFDLFTILCIKKLNIAIKMHV